VPAVLPILSPSITIAPPAPQEKLMNTTRPAGLPFAALAAAAFAAVLCTGVLVTGVSQLAGQRSAPVYAAVQAVPVVTLERVVIRARRSAPVAQADADRAPAKG
jgi:hypothetical protein